MRIVAMVEDLENRGFEVEKKYLTPITSYKFTISKDGCTVEGLYKFESDIHGSKAGHEKQLEFLRNLVEKWTREHDDCEKVNKGELTMDFRVKKLILEEGMKNIAETEGVKLEMSFDTFTKMVTVDFMYGRGGLHKETSYDCVEREDADIFKTIEDTRREVRAMKNPTAIGFMNGIHGGFHYPVSMDAIARAKEGINARYGYFSKSSKRVWLPGKIPEIKNVIFNYPATIVFWADGDKTVVKCQNDDVFDAEKGLAMAIIKKMNGGKGNYCEIFKPWIEKYHENEKRINDILKNIGKIWEHADVINDDIQDILEGKVDPLMIKTDEEDEAPIEKSCLTCDHKHKKVYEKPCEKCLEDTAGVLPKWEPKKKETKAPIPEKKYCWDCANYRSGKDKEPCCSCRTRRRNGTIHRNWEPKE